MSDRVAEILAFHGWGFSKEFWKPWNSLVSDRIVFKSADRGYFGPSESVRFSDGDRKRIVLTHSFGLFWCPEEILTDADHVVIISGYPYFHQDSGGGARRSRLVLQQMMARFVQEPEEVLLKFYENVFYPEETALEPPLSMNEELLLEDLSRLNSEKFSQNRLNRLPAATILHGEKDRIVSNERGRLLYHRLVGRSQYFEIKQAGHALPFTHMWECLKFLEPILSVN